MIKSPTIQLDDDGSTLQPSLSDYAKSLDILATQAADIHSKNLDTSTRDPAANYDLSELVASLKNAKAIVACCKQELDGIAPAITALGCDDPALEPLIDSDLVKACLALRVRCDVARSVDSELADADLHDDIQELKGLQDELEKRYSVALNRMDKVQHNASKAALNALARSTAMATVVKTLEGSNLMPSSIEILPADCYSDDPLDFDKSLKVGSQQRNNAVLSTLAANAAKAARSKTAGAKRKQAKQKRESEDNDLLSQIEGLHTKGASHE